jgi:hypothetical protein
LKILLQGQDVVVLLAAEHRDDVSPTSLFQAGKKFQRSYRTH